MSRAEVYLGNHQIGTLETSPKAVTSQSKGHAVLEQLELIRDADQRNQFADKIIDSHKLSQVDAEFARVGFRGAYISFWHILNKTRLIPRVFRAQFAVHEGGHKDNILATGGTVLAESITPSGGAEGFVSGRANEAKPFAARMRDLIKFAYGGMAAEKAVGKTDHSGCRHDMGLVASLKHELGGDDTGGLFEESYSNTRDDPTRLMQRGWGWAQRVGAI